MSPKNDPFLPGLEPRPEESAVPPDTLVRFASKGLQKFLSDPVVRGYALSSDPENPADIEAIAAMGSVTGLPDNTSFSISLPTAESSRFGSEGITVSDIVSHIADQLWTQHEFRCPIHVLKVAVECPTRTSSPHEIYKRMCKILRNPELMLFLRGADFTVTESIWDARDRISQLLQGKTD